MDAMQQFRTYVEFENRHEKWEIHNPVLSVHNLIVGSPYIDIGGNMKGVLVPAEGNQTEYQCVLNFTKKGWFSKADEYKVDGEVQRLVPGAKKPTILWKVSGNWNRQIKIAPVVDGKVDDSKWELVFDKTPYPENWEWQYGMSNFTMQLNYFPSWLDKYLPPTDTRRRPDQRFLEHGELVKAAKEKDRLETKQRTVRKWREDNKIEYRPFYFVEWQNPHDGGKTYWVYNNEYWEKDRKSLDWGRLPDLFTEALPFNVDEK